VITALPLTFPQLVGSAPAATNNEVLEIQLPTDPGSFPPPANPPM
jgi:hypothetical protein